MPGARIRGEA
jgi:hypothetical protein